MNETLPFQSAREIDSRRIRVSLIDIPSEYEGKDSLVEDDALRKSIEKSGVQQSIIVIPSDRNRFTLVKGARRVRISQIIGLTDIPAVINVPPGDADPQRYRNRLRMILTQARQDLLPSQRANLIKQLMQSFGLKQKEVAAYLGVDAGSITNWLSIDRYIPVVVKAIDSNEITMHTARAFDGMTHKGQEQVWKAKRKELGSLSGGKAHRLVRSTYSPKSHPEFYVAPAKTLEKLNRKRGQRATKSRPKLSRSEKDVLSRDLGLREIELSDSKEELSQLKKEITLAAQPIRAILRNKELLELIPAEMKDEFDRFAEVYI